MQTVLNNDACTLEQPNSDMDKEVTYKLIHEELLCNTDHLLEVIEQPGPTFTNSSHDM